jgi:hypothetical protein
MIKDVEHSRTLKLSKFTNTLKEIQCMNSKNKDKKH